MLYPYAQQTFTGDFFTKKFSDVDFTSVDKKPKWVI